tara:strand:- start:334 stop:534 length:201 start_codon:yes stop_codon:yes gene_type:complete
METTKRPEMKPPSISQFGMNQLNATNMESSKQLDDSKTSKDHHDILRSNLKRRILTARNKRVGKNN